MLLIQYCTARKSWQKLIIGLVLVNYIENAEHSILLFLNQYITSVDLYICYQVFALKWQKELNYLTYVVALKLNLFIALKWLITLK